MAQAVDSIILLSMTARTKTLDMELAEFRKDNPLVDCRNSKRWKYRRIGVGPDPIVWLTGALGKGDLAFRTIPLIGDKFCVILPDYPAVTSLDDACDGLIAIMDQENLGTVHIVGGSLGGMIAQHFVRRHPDRVRSLALSHTSAPEPSRMKVLMVKAAVGSLTVWPPWMVRRMFSRRLRNSFDVGDPFWLSYFDSQIADQSLSELVSRVQLAAEFAAADYSIHDLSQWAGRVLILESDNDPMMPVVVRRILRELYPAATVHTFSGTGHSISLTDPGKYAQAISSFLEAAN